MIRKVRNNYYRPKLIRVVSGVAATCVGLSLFVQFVEAQSGKVDVGSSTYSDCGMYYAYIYLCNGGCNGGGGSWRLYKGSNLTVKGVGMVSKDNYVDCGASGYYVAYGYESLVGNGGNNQATSRGHAGITSVTDPVAGYVGGRTTYNSCGAIGSSELRNSKGEFSADSIILRATDAGSAGVILDQATALSMYQAATGNDSYEAGTGWFCIDPEKIGEASTTTNTYDYTYDVPDPQPDPVVPPPNVAPSTASGTAYIGESNGDVIIIPGAVTANSYGDSYYSGETFYYLNENDGRENDGELEELKKVPDEEKYVGWKICGESWGQSYRLVYDYSKRYGVTVTEITHYKYNDDGEKVVDYVEKKETTTYIGRFVTGSHTVYSSTVTGEKGCVPTVKTAYMGVAGGNTYLEHGAETSVAIKWQTELKQGSWVEDLAITNTGDVIGNETRKGLSSGGGLYGGLDSDLNLDDTDEYSPETTSNKEESTRSAERIEGARITSSSGFMTQLKNSGLLECGYSSDSVEVICPEDGKIETGWINGDSNPETYKQRIYYSPSGDLIIDENVERLDAWLIAPNGTVNTCGGYDFMRTEEEDAVNLCTKQLKINGLVYAKNIVLSRTYGGYGSEWAEVINLSPASYAWAIHQANTTYASPVTVYTRELSPRI